MWVLWVLMSVQVVMQMAEMNIDWPSNSFLRWIEVAMVSISQHSTPLSWWSRKMIFDFVHLEFGAYVALEFSIFVRSFAASFTTETVGSFKAFTARGRFRCVNGTANPQSRGILYWQKQPRPHRVGLSRSSIRGAARSPGISRSAWTETNLLPDI